MKKSEITVTRKIYDLLPDVTSLKSAKIILVLLHAFRRVTNFKGSYGKLKKQLLGEVKEICSMKSFKENDAMEIKERIQHLSETDTEGIQKAVFADMQTSLYQLHQLNNSQNNDYKAVIFADSGSGTLGESAGRSVNAIRKTTSNFQTDIYYNTTKAVIAEAEQIVEKYVFAETMNVKSAKGRLSEIVK